LEKWLYTMLAVASGSVLGVSGFFTVYPVVAFSVALKLGLFALLVLRLDARDQVRVPLAVAATAWWMLLSAFTIDSFSADSFLAQVVAELFAVAMLWAMVVWSQRPSVWSVAIFGLAGMATFLTWPMWIGPMLVALTLVMLVHRETPPAMKGRHFVIAVAPVLVVAAIHLAGRTAALSIVATSGAVPQPSLASIGWVLPLLAVPGLVVATKTPAGRVIAALALGLAAQAGALWFLARQSGATTPYMALKMGHLAVYPLTAAAVLTLARLPRAHVWARLAALLAIGFALAHVPTRDRPVPTVAKDLWQAGMWAREHLPADDIDYLVRNEYTAYWLHLAVLGNSRADLRSMNDDTYLTAPSFARWIADAEADARRYAVARASVLPREIRERTRVLRQFGDAVIIERMAPTGHQP
jgi:hypothetical protein